MPRKGEMRENRKQKNETTKVAYINSRNFTRSLNDHFDASLIHTININFKCVLNNGDRIQPFKMCDPSLRCCVHRGANSNL